MTNRRLILVTGATGRQGGAVARHLLSRGFRVRALTRDPSKPAARELANRGAHLAQGDLDDTASIQRALQDVHGVFSVQNFWETGYEREVRQGINLADAASAEGVSHFVYSSVASANCNTGLPHFDSKWQIEKHIRNIGLPYSILRPVFFMENWLSYLRDQILAGTLPQPLDPDRPLQQIATDDIGAIVTMAIENPNKWMGCEMDLAGDECTMPQVAGIFTRILGREVKYAQVPWDDFRQAAGEEMWRMYRWFNDVGYEADISALRQEYPQLKSIERALRDQNWPRLAIEARGEQAGGQQAYQAGA